MEKIKVGAVSYLNTKPLLFGIERLEIRKQIELVTDHPANIGHYLIENKIDVGLVPVAVIPRLKECHIVSDYCIGSENTVATVGLFSDVPVDEIERVLLDYQSETSVNLVKILFRNYWKKAVVFEETRQGFRNEIKGTTAGVVIGDRAFEQRQLSPWVYDLGEAWRAYSGLPFVFAAWIANKPLPASFLQDFNVANQYGLDHLGEVLKHYPRQDYDLNHYYTENISYYLDEKMRAGLNRFLCELSRMPA